MWGRNKKEFKGLCKKLFFLGSSFFPHFCLIPKFKIYPLCGSKERTVFFTVRLKQSKLGIQWCIFYPQWSRNGQSLARTRKFTIFSISFTLNGYFWFTLTREWTILPLGQVLQDVKKTNNTDNSNNNNNQPATSFNKQLLYGRPCSKRVYF